MYISREQATIIDRNFEEAMRVKSLIGRSLLFFLFLLSGILLDAYWTWYSYHFDAVCAESGNAIPGTWFLFTTIMLIPGSVSLVFGNNPLFVFTCFFLWFSCAVLHVYGIETMDPIGVNCYRDIGAGTAVELLFTSAFSTIVIALTLAFGVVLLVRKSLRAHFPGRDRPT